MLCYVISILPPLQSRPHPPFSNFRPVAVAEFMTLPLARKNKTKTEKSHWKSKYLCIPFNYLERLLVGDRKRRAHAGPCRGLARGKAINSATLCPWETWVYAWLTLFSNERIGEVSVVTRLLAPCSFWSFFPSYKVWDSKNDPEPRSCDLMPGQIHPVHGLRPLPLAWSTKLPYSEPENTFRWSYNATLLNI